MANTWINWRARTRTTHFFVQIIDFEPFFCYFSNEMCRRKKQLNNGKFREKVMSEPITEPQKRIFLYRYHEILLPIWVDWNGFTLHILKWTKAIFCQDNMRFFTDFRYSFCSEHRLLRMCVHSCLQIPKEEIATFIGVKGCHFARNTL